MDFEHYDGRKKGKDGSDLFCIYKLSHGDMIYIGYTIGTKARFTKHQEKSSNCRYIRNAIRKHGWDEFQATILETDLTKEEACFTEEYYVDWYDCLVPNGYNLTTGGEHCELSEESKKLISEHTKKQWKDENYRKQRSKDMKTHMKERWGDEQYRIKISNSQKKRYEKEDERENARKSHAHMRKFTDEELIAKDEELKGSVSKLSVYFGISKCIISRHKKRLELTGKCYK